MQTVNSKQNKEETDGIVTDAILQIVKISEFLKKNIDSLHLPTMLKENKKLVFVHKQKTKRHKKIQRRPMMPVGRGENNNDQVRIRNRHYKIKRILAQPRNIDVRHNGTVVRRMAVRRRTIYPSAQRTREY